MTGFLQKPNLPETGVTLCALASGSPCFRGKLETLGVKVVEIAPHPALPEQVCRHADLQIHPLKGGAVLVAKGSEPAMISALKKEKLSVKQICLPLSSRYPGDIALCCFSIGETLYCHPEHTAPEIRSLYSRISPVRQGYARCSTCIVDEGSIITADTGLAAAAEANGLSVLRIRPGWIELPGYDYGFIGGSCGLLSQSLLAFTGDICTHPDGGQIQVFCRERGVEILALRAGPLVDIGGIIPLKQQMK